MNEEIKKEMNLPQWYKFLSNIASYLPPLNSIKGIMFYTFIIFIISVFTRIMAIKLGLKSKNNDMGVNNVDEKLRKKIEDKRAKRAEEAKQLLEKVTKIY
jgi:hypothetical protein